MERCGDHLGLGRVRASAGANWRRHRTIEAHPQRAVRNACAGCFEAEFRASSSVPRPWSTAGSPPRSMNGSTKVYSRWHSRRLVKRVTRIITASAYMCRQRIGSSNQRLSEHSFANALDISAFVIMDGRSIDVLTGWGQTARDRQAQATDMAGGGGDARPLRDIAPSEGSQTKDSLFLRRVHESACGVFGTVLGPEANEAHRNHLHLDLAARRHKSFCE